MEFDQNIHDKQATAAKSVAIENRRVINIINLSSVHGIIILIVIIVMHIINFDLTNSFTHFMDGKIINFTSLEIACG